MVSFSYKKNERLLNRKDFVNLNKTGKRHHSAHFTLITHNNRLGKTRLGITASRRTGNAVRRNRIKRLIREYFRLHKHQFPQGFDVVIVAKKGAGDLEYREVQKELGHLTLAKTFNG
jgi:ribonuclease P protein component